MLYSFFLFYFLTEHFAGYSPSLKQEQSTWNFNTMGHLIKTDNTRVNTRVNTEVDTGVDTGLNPFHQVTQCAEWFQFALGYICSEIT